MSRKTSPISPAPTTTSLALSNMYVQLDALEKEHQNLLKQIKRKRTEVNNFIEKMRSLGAEMFHRASPSFQKIAELDQEIHTLFKKIFANKKISQRMQTNIKKVYLNLQLTGIISPKHMGEQETEELEEKPENPFSGNSGDQHQHQKREQDWTSPTVEKTEDSRRIRQTFLKLAEIFHPDKVMDSEIQMSHTEVMKEINKAYQEGDLARLLEIERQHNLGESIDRNSEDDLTRRYKILKQQNEILKQQYENLKRELRRVKKTPEGQMVADFRKSAKVGLNSMDLMVKTLEYQVEVVSGIRDFVKDFTENKLTIAEFLNGPTNLQSLEEKAMTEILEEMLGKVIF